MRQRKFAISRRSLLGGLGIGVIGVGLGAPGTAVAARREQVRFGCFNIHHGASPDDVMDLERVASQIETMNCDVIGLQEVDRFWKRSGFVDEPAWLADRLGMEVAFGANLNLDPDEPGRPRRQYGTAMLSRWAVMESDNTLLPRVGDHEQRGLLRAVLDAPGGPVTFATTHLMHGTEESERVAQAKAIGEILGADPRRTILVGDFNAEPGAESIAVITENLTDAWAAVGDGEGLTYPSVNPHSRIDYVFASSDVVPGSMAVNAEDPQASDHLPLSGGFAL